MALQGEDVALRNVKTAMFRKILCDTEIKALSDEKMGAEFGIHRFIYIASAYFLIIFPYALRRKCVKKI